MKNIFQYLEGDKGIWAAVFVLAVFSFLPVYSASSNLAYHYANGNTFSYLLKHGIHLIIGFAILYAVHKIPFRYFQSLSLIMMPVIFFLLILTMAEGTTIDGANASRWLKVPVVGVTFQTSTLAGVVLMAYVARYLSRIQNKEITFKESVFQLWIPVFLVLALILPANFSTTAIFFAMIVVLVFVGGYSLKYLGFIMAIGVVALGIFVLGAKAFPTAFPNRVDTWIKRVENFGSNEKDPESSYQIDKAKIAIASGGLNGLGPGKSVQKNFLPQSSSDFIYAIIVEEYGLILGGIGIMTVYLYLLFRMILVVRKTTSIFGKLLVTGVGLLIILTALINMAVAVELFPVTGQNLPLISSGGTSIWVTCMAFGMILSVSAKRTVEIKEEAEENPLDILSEAI